MLRLVKLSNENYPLLIEMMDEWTAVESSITPYVISKNDYHEKEKYMSEIEVKEGNDRLVPDSTFFLLDTERNIFLGACNIRHYLNERLLIGAGHIGDGIRPSERRKGYGARLVTLALSECRKLGIDRVLMCCKKENIPSMKTIISNGGVLENEVEFEGKTMLRFWIDLKNEKNSDKKEP